MNGIMVKGDAAGITMYSGAGAGSRETASAVVADLVDLARALGGGGRMCVPSGSSSPTLGGVPLRLMREYVRGAVAVSSK